MSKVIEADRYQVDPGDWRLRLQPPGDRRLLIGPAPVHLDGVWWYKAPRPRRWHKCWAQTRAWMDLRLVERCACGAIRGAGISDDWYDRNSRKAAA